MKYLLRFFMVFFLLLGPVFAESLRVEAPSRADNPLDTESVVVLGGGIGGLTSALYLARSGLHPLVIEGIDPGGLLKQSHSVQNWPGEMEIDGSLFIDKVRNQAKESGAQFLSEQVVSVDFSQTPLVIFTRAHLSQEVRQIRADACIVAMGTQPNFLSIPGETGPDGYWGRGVTNCAVCDGPFYRDQVVAVVGGGDAAVTEALYLADIAKEVQIFVRKSGFKATEKKRVEALLKLPNVKVFYDTEVKSIQGDGKKVTGVTLNSKSKGTYESSLDGVFLAIGSKPNTALFKDSLKLDSSGYIALEKDQQTSQRGVYAVGDIVDPVYKQAISAAGDGAKAALQAQQFISDGGSRQKKILRKKAKVVEREVSLPIEITSLEQFETILAEENQWVVVDFYAPWCRPCKQISPLLDSLAPRLPSKVKIVKVNVDQFPDLCNFYDIQSIPTLLVFHGPTQLVDRKVSTNEIVPLLGRMEADFDAAVADFSPSSVR